MLCDQCNRSNYKKSTPIMRMPPEAHLNANPIMKSYSYGEIN